MAGAIDPVNINWHSWGANGALSKLLGRHTLKFGVDYRLIGLDFQSFADGAGDFRFDRCFTSSNPTRNGTAPRRATPSRASCSAIPRAIRQTSTRRRVDAAQAVHELLRRLRAGRLPRRTRSSRSTTASASSTRPGLREKRRRHHRRLRSHADASGGALGNVVVERPACTRRARVCRRRTAPTVPGRSAGAQGVAAAGPRLLVQPEDRAPRRLRDLLGAVELPGAGHHQLRPDRLQPGDAHPAGPVPADGHAEQPVPERPAAAGRQRAAAR